MPTPVDLESLLHTLFPDSLIDYQTRAQQRIQQTRIALMKEGYEKERAVARNAFAQEKARIEREERERLALYERQRRAGRNVAPGEKSTILAQAATQRVQAAQLLDNALAGIDEREQRDAALRQQQTDQKLRELLAKYRDFEAQRAALSRQGNADIAALEAQRTADNAQQIDRAIAVARQRMEQGVRSVNDAEAAGTSGDNAFLKQLYGDYASLGFGALRDLIAQARQLREHLGGSAPAEGITFIAPQELERIKKSPAELDKMRGALDKLLETGRKGSGDKWENIFRAFEKGYNELGKSKSFEDISGAIATIGGAASQASGELVTLFEQMGNTQAAEVIGGVKQMMGALSSIGQGFAQGGALGGIGASIGVALNFLGQAFAADKRHREALREIERARRDFQRQYNLALLQQNLLLKEATNIFGEREIAKAATTIKVYQDALAEFNGKMKGKAPRKTWAELVLGDISGSYARRLEQYRQGIFGLAQQQIVTGHEKTGLFGWGKGRDVYSSILSVYPELIDQNGQLDTAMLKTILSTRKMSKETRAYLQHLLDLKDVMDEAEQALEDNLAKTFGSLGDSVLERVREMTKGVTGAYADMRDDIAAILEDLGEQVVYSLFFADKFDKLQEELKAVYGSGKDEESIALDAMDLLDAFFSSLGPDMNAAKAWMEGWRNKAAEKGFDLWASEGSSQSGRAGALTTLTQEQGTRLEGLMTSIQMHEASIDDKFDNIVVGMGQSLDALHRIEHNTDTLPLMLALWQAIKRDGLKMK